MKTINDFIESKQQEFIQHPFFNLLEKMDTIEEISYFVPELTFWAMTFQDILRINEEHVIDPYLKKVARHHRLEDAGHEKWFLSDKKYMGTLVNNPSCHQDNVAWLFSKDTEVTRDAAYAILSEIYKADEEILNIIMLLTLESSGHVFFDKVVQQVAKTGEDKNLQYFSSSHLDVEMAHALFEEEMERKLFERKLSVATRRKALLMVENCYNAFSKMFDGLLVACQKRMELAKERTTQHAANSVEKQDSRAISG